MEFSSHCCNWDREDIHIFLPALYEKTGVTFVIVPLKKLAHQHHDSAIKLGLTAISLEAETISKDVINVCFYCSTLTNRLIPCRTLQNPNTDTLSWDQIYFLAIS